MEILIEADAPLATCMWPTVGLQV